jgi:hypothetical protein
MAGKVAVVVIQYTNYFLIIIVVVVGNMNYIQHTIPTISQSVHPLPSLKKYDLICLFFFWKPLAFIRIFCKK